MMDEGRGPARRLLGVFAHPDDDIRSARVQVKMAKLICRGCPVSATCLNWALAGGQGAGIWGGLTEDERRRLPRRGLLSASHRLARRGKS